MKKFALMVVMLACIIFVLTGCYVEETPQKVDNTTDTTQAKTETYKIGDAVKIGNLVFTVNSIRTSEGNDFIKPDEGKIYYLVDVTVENTGDKSETVSSLMMFKLFDSQGYNYTITIGPETQGSVDGEISAGKKLRGELAFEIPKDATGLELQIDPTLFGSGQIIVKLDR